MTEHHIKLLKYYADAVLSGDKTFEVRENDRGYQKGDKVVFKVVDKSGIHFSHPVESITYEITYVLNGWGIKDGWVVFGIREYTESEEV